MEPINLIVLVVLVLTGGAFLIRRLKHGSWVGAFLKGRIERTYGQILLSSSDVRSEVLKIMELKGSEGEAFVGLVVITKGRIGANIAPYRLSKEHARELSGLLALASK